MSSSTAGQRSPTARCRKSSRCRSERASSSQRSRSRPSARSPRSRAADTSAGYLKNILRQKHWSVLEHANASFYITGVSRT
ncbi:FAD-dependent thymidylate synthase, partial [Nocardia sp. NPDC004722]